MNDKLFKTINQLAGRCSPMDMLMILISNKIRYVFIFVLIFMWIRNGLYRKASRYAVFSAGITWILHCLIKLCYYKPRPFIKRSVGILIPSKTDSSFLSKHTLLAFAISTSIFLYQRVLGQIMMVLSFLTGFSRIWVGHHFPSDIYRSALIGTITSIIFDKACKCINYFSRKKNRDGVY